MEEKVKTFLDEGFDFIEESYSEFPLEFTEIDKDIIVESKDNKQRPYHILGVCKGVFQPINEPSRNFRIYDSDHWSYQISKPELQERLQNRQMLGQIGHRDSRVDDLTISRGEVSHVVTCMEIREDANGKPYLYGELEILDTPAGRILKGLYEGGVGLYISSRGAGKLEDIPEQFGQHDRRMKRVSKTSFFLETWDIVKAPGFLKAKPVYEGIKEEQEVSEAQADDDYEWSVVRKNALANPNLYDGRYTDKDAKKAKKQYLEDKEYARLDKARRDSAQVRACESSELQALQSQIAKLTKIIEKVVDDVYEEEPTNEEVQKQPIAEPNKEDKLDVGKVEEKGDEKQVEVKSVKEALADFVSLMADTNISEKAFEEVIDIIAQAKKENK